MKRGRKAALPGDVRSADPIERALALREEFPDLADKLADAAINSGKTTAFGSSNPEAVWDALDRFADMLASTFARDQDIEKEAISPSEYLARLQRLQASMRAFLEVHHFCYLVDEHRALGGKSVSDFRPKHRGHEIEILAEVARIPKEAKEALIGAASVVDDLIGHATTAHRPKGQAADFRARGQAVAKLARFSRALRDELGLDARLTNNISEYVWMRADLPNFAAIGETLREWLRNQLKLFWKREDKSRRNLSEL